MKKSSLLVSPVWMQHLESICLVGACLLVMGMISDIVANVREMIA